MADLLAADDVGPLGADALIVLADLERLGTASALLEEALREASSPVLVATMALAAGVVRTPATSISRRVLREHPRACTTCRLGAGTRGS